MGSRSTLDRKPLGLFLFLTATCGGRSEFHENQDPARSDQTTGGASASGAPASGGTSSTGGNTGPEASGGSGTGGATDQQPSGGTLGAAGADGTDPSGCDEELVRFATTVIDHRFGPGQNHNQVSGFPEALFGPPEAGDPRSVVSLGNGGFVILAFGSSRIVDGPGPDFVVFENPLPGFAELATVAVSDDLRVWHEFPCTAAQDAEDKGFCAGVQPVYANSDNGIDPLDPEVAGGDWFDLADLGVSSARYVRITDRVDLTGFAGVFDLDAVGLRHAACP